MPGMMDPVLNVGLSPDAVEQLAIATENPRFALDSYRRFQKCFVSRPASISLLASIRDEVLSLARGAVYRRRRGLAARTCKRIQEETR